ncbi:hypothetical protein RN001_001679 [Aquatica leii]|uniref:Essential protein Yae1 N-terminal domain-containing protein n=1 Tax=Aquatica leii TaxID=1421715 RepID=A0AAN7QN09_9COLE|nr:hypothetical protein RN001_001679 [Aquatica leii]
MSINANEDAVILNSWNKYADTAKKAGYRDGAADGKKKVFQKSFDEGYLQGFRVGFALGQYKGILQENNLCDKQLEHTRRGLCQLCKNSIVTEDSIQGMIEQQVEICNGVLKNLHRKYSDNMKMSLRKEL